MTTLTTAISTIKFDAHTMTAVRNAKSPSKHNLLVISQKHDSELGVIMNDDERCVVSKDTGLSNSRNQALFCCDTDLLHFCDDDLRYSDEYYETIAKSAQEFPNVAIFLFRIGLDDGPLYKKYPNGDAEFSWKEVFSVSSCEMVVRPSVIKKAGLLFDNNFGLGTAARFGEEAAFVSDALRKSLLVKRIPKIIVQHAEESTGAVRDLTAWCTRGELIIRCYGLVGYAFVLPYIIMHLRRSRITLREMRAVLKGVRGAWRRVDSI